MTGLGLVKYHLQFVSVLCLGLDFLDLLFSVTCGILLHEAVQLNGEIGVEPLFQHVYLARDLREVQEQHLVSPLQVGGVMADPQVAEQFLEAVLLAAVIVGVEHAQEDALAKTTGTDEEEVAGLLLQLWQEHRLVNIIEVLGHHRCKIRDAVRYLFYLLLHVDMMLKRNVHTCKNRKKLW